MDGVVSVVEKDNDHMVIRIRKGMLRMVILSCDKQDPAVALNAYADNIRRGLDFINVQMPQIPPWAAALIAYPVSVEGFKTAVLNCVRIATAGGVADNFIIYPNTGSEFAGISQLFHSLCCDPWVVAVANAAGAPLGRVHAFYERRVTQGSVNVTIVRPLGLGPNDQQAFI
eukprot:gene27419-33118_t